jgi:hypothetical protein
MKSILVTSFVVLTIFSGAVFAQDNIEKKKIEFLISSVEKPYMIRSSDGNIMKSEEYFLEKLKEYKSTVK